MYLTSTAVKKRDYILQAYTDLWIYLPLAIMRVHQHL